MSIERSTRATSSLACDCHHAPCEHDLMREDGRGVERAAIVADLRREAHHWSENIEKAIRMLADRYERGEHLRKEPRGIEP